MGEADKLGRTESAIAHSDKPDRPRLKPEGSRIPDGSRLYGRLLPSLIIGMAVLMVVLIVVAAGVLLGYVPFR